MVERAHDAPAWTPRRVFGWAGLSVVALFVAGIAMGFLAAHLDGGSGDRVWSGRISGAAPFVVFAVIALMIWAAVRRSWPARVDDGADAWQRQAAGRMRRTAAAWLGTVIALLAAGAAGSAAAWLGVETPAGLALLIAAVGLGVGGMIWGTIVYMRVVDEQERQANLLACYAGFSTYIALYFGQLLVARVGIDLPPLDHAIFGVTMVVALVTFVIARFR